MSHRQRKKQFNPNHDLHQQEKREYHILCLLPFIPDNDLPQPKYNPQSLDIAPLVISSTMLPLNCFSSPIVCLLSMYDRRLCRSAGSPECLFHNVVSLYSPNVPVQMVLIDAANHLEIHIIDHIHAKKKIEQDLFPDICIHVYNTVFAALRDVFDTMQITGIDVTPVFLCSCSSFSESHSASVYKFHSEWFL